MEEEEGGEREGMREEGRSRGVQPYSLARGLHVAQDGHECGSTQNCKFP